jgi:NAD(P)-dependent dehydrogenase (short-subunit alcohol dehydrogenase family)
MMNRKEDQGDRAIEDIKNECKEKGLPAPDISWRGVDLGDFQQTKEVFAALASEEARLDILVLSSGINANQFRQAITSLETVPSSILPLSSLPIFVDLLLPASMVTCLSTPSVISLPSTSFTRC